MTTKKVEALAGRAATLLRDAAKASPDRRTGLLRELAGVIVDLRSRHTMEDGRTDWSGRSSDYRELIADVYSKARLPERAQETTLSALRYHVGNRLREVAPEEDLEDLGLARKRPVERVKDTRDRLSALARAGAAVESSSRKSDVVRLVTGAEVVLSKVDPSEVPPEKVAAVLASLDAIARKVEDLRASLSKGNGDPKKSRRLRAI
jgi:hypothetical protein